MDAATEPLIVVIDHPVAGNPTQFAIESALRALKLEWRVLSFDVAPDNVSVALDGFAVIGITGVMIGPSLQEHATVWYRDRFHDDPPRIDCLSRNQQGSFVGTAHHGEWTTERVRGHLKGSATPLRGIWFGDTAAGLPVDGDLLADQPSPVPPPAETIENANWIALTTAESGPARIEEADWPEDDGSTLVIDLSQRAIDTKHPALDTLSERGYQVVTGLDRMAGTLVRAIRFWTGIEPPPDVIRDAIEEYLGV